jgi:hypothetical protein
VTDKRTRLGILGLVVVLCVLAGVIYMRGTGARLGAPPAPLEGPYKTEESWVVTEVARDVAEMTAYPARGPQAAIAAAAPNGYRVTTDRGTVELDLRDEVWAPGQFAAIARSVAASATAVNALAPVYPSLLPMTPKVIIAAAAAASRALAANMRDPRAHESAALVVGAFALRDSAGRFADSRWALNRMTAHLAMASALTDAAGPDGRIAHALLLVLLNRQTHALAAVDALERDDPTPAGAAWARALRLRVTQDWRKVDDPSAASPLEQREYFRARRATVSTSMGRTELERLHAEPSADFVRLIESSSLGVEDGWFVEQMRDFERGEFDSVFQQIHGRAMPDDPTDSLNARASRAIGPNGPDVLPWGAWAEFAQRHLSLYFDRYDRFYRHQIGDTKLADANKRAMTRAWGRLTTFPLATIFWTAGRSGGDADLTLINPAVSVLLRSPERVTLPTWSFLENGTHFEPIARGIPKPDAWFMAASPRVTENAGGRVQFSGHPHGPQITAAVMREAPYDFALGSDYLLMKYGKKAPADAVRDAFGARAGYDIRVLRLAVAAAPDDVARMPALRTLCDLAAAECIAVGDQLVKLKQEPEAAAAYERAFADTSVDAIKVANASYWLVDYYRRTNRVDQALELATRSAATGAYQGLVTLGWLYEHLDRFAEAEEAFRSSATNYKDYPQLLAFYYRDVNVRKQSRYEKGWRETLARLFPHGLTAVSTDPSKPSHGVVLMSDSTISRGAGLLSGDIIVGLEGWRVDDYQQYRAINAFFTRNDMTLTIWRPSALKSVAVTAPSRLMGVDMRSYPIQGWRE